MDTVQFLGTYSALPAIIRFGLPTVTENSLWQVWKYADDVYWITPFGSDELLQDDGYTITYEVFSQGFSRADSSTVQIREQIYANSPDLIATLMQRAGAGKNTCTAALLEEGTGAYWGAPSRISSAAAVTGHGVSDSIPPPDSASAVSVQPDLAMPTSSLPPLAPVARQEFMETAAAQPASGAEPAGGEMAMRQEFTLLLELTHTASRDMALRELAELVSRTVPRTWKYKYMFSEFGLALRKECLHELALACHNQALACSPKDENVLFNLARTEFELGRIDEAKVHLNLALQVAPDFTAAKNFYSFLSSR